MHLLLVSLENMIDLKAPTITFFRDTQKILRNTHFSIFHVETKKMCYLLEMTILQCTSLEILINHALVEYQLMVVSHGIKTPEQNATVFL